MTAIAVGSYALPGRAIFISHACEVLFTSGEVWPDIAGSQNDRLAMNECVNDVCLATRKHACPPRLSDRPLH